MPDTFVIRLHCDFAGPHRRHENRVTIHGIRPATVRRIYRDHRGLGVHPTYARGWATLCALSIATGVEVAKP